MLGLVQHVVRGATVVGQVVPRRVATRRPLVVSVAAGNGLYVFSQSSLAVCMRRARRIAGGWRLSAGFRQALE